MVEGFLFCQDHDHYHFQLRLLDQEFCHVFRFPLKAISYAILHAGTRHADIKESIAIM